MTLGNTRKHINLLIRHYFALNNCRFVEYIGRIDVGPASAGRPGGREKTKDASMVISLDLESSKDCECALSLHKSASNKPLLLT